MLRVLFISASPLRRDVSIGNTFLSLFAESKNIELASIYTKGGIPDPEISTAFLISEKMLLKRLFNKFVLVGKTINPENAGDSSGEKTTEDAFTTQTRSFFHKNRLTLFFWLQNTLWMSNKWKSPQLEKFLLDYKPDIIFTLLSDAQYLNRLILYTNEVCDCKLAIYAWDDNYSYKLSSVSPLRFLHQSINRRYMREVVEKADVLYAISETQRVEYEQAFKKQFKLLTKSANFDSEPPVWSEPTGTVGLLYAGNLGAGRWKSLALIADAVEHLNREGYSVKLDTYSATPQTKAMQKALNRKGCALNGPVSHQEVQSLQREADILIHVEGLSLKSRMAVHQSFSTKLVDYFALGKCIFAVGTSDMASVRHLLDNDAAIVAQTKKTVYSQLKQILDNPGLLRTYGENAYLCGRKHHNKTTMQSMLMNDLKRVIENHKSSAK